MGAWVGLVVVVQRVLGRDWTTPGGLNVACLTLGAATCSCLAATLALVMAGFAGPPARTTTIGFVTRDGGSGWVALDRAAEGFLVLFGWTAAFGLGVLSILSWLAVVVAAWRLIFGPASARPTG